MDITQTIFMLWRMLPFIITAFFVLSGIMHGSTAGILVFVGLFLSSLFSSFIGKKDIIQNILNPNGNQDFINKLKKCNIFYYGDSPSLLPLSINTYGFVLGYLILVLTISKQVNFSNNTNYLASLILLALLLVSEVIYLGKTCYSDTMSGWLVLIVFTIITMAMGAIWVRMIGSKNTTKSTKNEMNWFIPGKQSNEKCNLVDNSYVCNG